MTAKSTALAAFLTISALAVAVTARLSLAATDCTLIALVLSVTAILTLAATGDATKFAIVSEYTLIVKAPKAHGAVIGLNGS